MEVNLESKLLSKCPLFTEKGLIFDSDIPFHRRNLLIGRNGSGKTRFLKALEGYLKESSPNSAVVTLYFPECHLTQDVDRDISLYDAIYSKENISFQDFLHLASKDGLALLDDIYTGMSLRANKTAQKMKKDFESLNKKFRIFFDGELCPKENNSEIYMAKHINGVERRIPITQATKEFSPGERMLFYLSILVFYLEHLSESTITLILDEPEIHLHPKALITLMDMLTQSNAVSQLWVASHSLFIMPLFPFEQIVHLDRNHIRPLNRNTYSKIYDELIGLENVDMYELLKSVENWAYYKFIVENFFLPQTKISTNKDDEQVQKFLTYLNSVRTTRPVRVLDYGAGKFRLWECLKQALPDANKRAKNLQYEAFEPYPSTANPRGICVFNNENKIRRGCYDVVVLMNVLHEIDPSEWLKTFHLIGHLLNDDGVLVFLEVFTLTNGEQPYGQAGYLLLQDQQVKQLFHHSSIVPQKQGKREKTNCWIVPKLDLLNTTQQDVNQAISSLESHCEEQLKKLDEKRIQIAHNADTNNLQHIKLSGREYAFLSQQYINAHFANCRLKALQNKNNPQKKISKQADKPIFPGIEITE